MAGVNYLTVYKLLEEIERHPYYEPKGDKGMSALYCYEILNRKGEYEVNAETWEEILKKLEAPKTLRKQVTLGDLPEELRSKIMEYKGDLSGIHNEMIGIKLRLRYAMLAKEIIAGRKLHKENPVLWTTRHVEKCEKKLATDRRNLILEAKSCKCWRYTLCGSILNTELSWVHILLRRGIDVCRYKDIDRYAIDNYIDYKTNWTKSNMNMKMTRVKLQGMCRENGLKTSGTKKELLNRLMSL